MSATVSPPECRYGLFLNLGANLGSDAGEVMDLTLAQAELAERVGFGDLWVSEHHFIPFGLNPSALTTAGFLLGRTSRLRVGTAVVLSPLQRPLAIAEQAVLLDRLSGGRFDLGIGRGGYLKDYELLGVDTSRWDEEPLATARAFLDACRGGDLAAEDHITGPGTIQPEPLTRPHPPLLLATSSPENVEFAAANGLALQHYFASPVESRVELERAYAAADPVAEVDHLHQLIAVVTDDEERTRAALCDALATSFGHGDWPKVPQQPERHVGPDGEPIDRGSMARFVANGAIVGDAASVVEQLADFRERTGARRIAIYAEAIADRGITLQTIEALGSALALGDA